MRPEWCSNSNNLERQPVGGSLSAGGQATVADINIGLQLFPILAETDIFTACTASHNFNLHLLRYRLDIDSTSTETSSATSLTPQTANEEAHDLPASELHNNVDSSDATPFPWRRRDAFPAAVPRDGAGTIANRP